MSLALNQSNLSRKLAQTTNYVAPRAMVDQRRLNFHCPSQHYYIQLMINVRSQQLFVISQLLVKNSCIDVCRSGASGDLQPTCHIVSNHIAWTQCGDITPTCTLVSREVQCGYQRVGLKCLFHYLTVDIQHIVLESKYLKMWELTTYSIVRPTQDQEVVLTLTGVMKMGHEPCYFNQISKGIFQP